MTMPGMPELKPKGGRPRVFKTPDDLLRAFEDYNNFRRAEVNLIVAYRGKTQVSEPAAPNIFSFAAFCECSQRTLERLAHDPEFENAWSFIKTAIAGELISVGLLKHGRLDSNLVARLVGLSSKREVVTVTAPNGGQQIDAYDLPNKVHPRAPLEDKMSDAPLLFSQRQIDAGVEYPAIVIEHREA